MAVIGWRTDVNQRILDATTITLGEGGFVEDASSNGFKLRRATSLAVPDKYQVTMDFDWLEKNKSLESEFDRFVKWYKYRHQYGANPFWFESISRFNINGPVIGYDNKPVMCQYKIISAPNFSKSGFSMRCTMTWEEVYGGVIEISKSQVILDRVTAFPDGHIEIIYKGTLDEVPMPTTGAIKYYKGTSLVPVTNKTKVDSDFKSLSTSRVYVDGNKIVYICQKLTEKGTYLIVYDTASGATIENAKKSILTIS